MTFNFSMQAIDHVINSASKTFYMSAGLVRFIYLYIFIALLIQSLNYYIWWLFNIEIVLSFGNVTVLMNLELLINRFIFKLKEVGRLVEEFVEIKKKREKNNISNSYKEPKIEKMHKYIDDIQKEWKNRQV